MTAKALLVAGLTIGASLLVGCIEADNFAYNGVAARASFGGDWNDTRVAEAFEALGFNATTASETAIQTAQANGTWLQAWRETHRSWLLIMNFEDRSQTGLTLQKASDMAREHQTAVMPRAQDILASVEAATGVEHTELRWEPEIVEAIF